MFVYTHTNKNTGEIFYVGKSKSKSSRPYQRSKSTRSKLWWDYFTEQCGGNKDLVEVNVIECETEGKALNVEWDMINELRPVANQQYNPCFEQSTASRLSNEASKAAIASRAASKLGIKRSELLNAKPIGCMPGTYAVLYEKYFLGRIVSGDMDVDGWERDFVYFTDNVHDGDLNYVMFEFVPEGGHCSMIDLIDDGLNIMIKTAVDSGITDWSCIKILIEKFQDGVKDFNHLKELIEKL